MQVNTKKIITFLIINFALSSVFYYVIIKGSLSILTSGGLMWMPGISAMLTQWLFNKNIKGFGWRFGKARYLAMSLMIPLLTCMVVYGLVWMTQTGGFSLLRMTELYHMPVGTLVLVLPTLFFALNLIFALGEEIAWRGFLAGELLKGGSYIKASLIIAPIWFIWHCPVIIFSSYHSNGIPLWYSLAVIFVSTMAFTFITMWIRVQSGSLWGAALFHASHNFFSQQVFDVITIDYAKTRYITSEFGAGIMLVYIIGAVWCLFAYRHQAKKEAHPLRCDGQIMVREK